MGKYMCCWFVVAILALMAFQIVQLDLAKHIDIGIPPGWHCKAAFQDQVRITADNLHSGGILWPNSVLS
jgi:hypothetical protein